MIPRRIHRRIGMQYCPQSVTHSIRSGDSDSAASERTYERAYARIPNNGTRSPPRFITRWPADAYRTINYGCSLGFVRRVLIPAYLCRGAEERSLLFVTSNSSENVCFEMKPACASCQNSILSHQRSTYFKINLC